MMIEDGRVASNKRRLTWRLRCCNRLSAHIEKTLGIKVDPDKICLQPNNKTPYTWQVDNPDLKPFFGKLLSKHSVGVYIELCSAVGQSFRAVHRDQAVKRQAADPGRREDFVGKGSKSRKRAKLDLV
ncbi:hypothetical protein BJX63DRAFT_416684 [Aspergillus granulosus]|uniref:Uncharacterized protein n=1 Tax=Aspergillus granulosus TaxID=176169 RepID=A0ABR4GRP5_9EURO